MTLPPTVGRRGWFSFWPATIKGRERVRAVALLLAAGLLGYLVTLLAYPAPLVPREHPLDRLLGLPVETARDEASGQGFRVSLEEPQPDPVIPSGHVVWQDPPPGTALPRGAAVRLTPSRGPAPVAVPDLSGFDLELARQVMQAAGLRVGKVDSLVSAAEPGVVVTSKPASGTSRAPGTPVDLVVSRGLADIRVPDLLGVTAEAAREKLENAGLKVGMIGKRRARGPADIVVDQRPAPGMLSPRGGRVNLTVSQ